MNSDKSFKMRIYLESFDSALINSTCQKITEHFKQDQTTIVGPISLPMKKRIYCVLRSPHVDKDSREHLEIRIYKRIFDIYSDSLVSSPNLDDIGLNFPSGVFVSFS
jgi:small subunit ribosomal protein S10|tara:strand:+ start:17381 stop:17701 length:321 start_codon:yes stop_codon:yes gene_type:complete